jgi:hypothetical protein
MKCAKVMPALANANATSAVIGVLGVCWLIAAAKHVLPSAVNRTFPKSVLGRISAVFAPAGFRSSVSQARAHRSECCPAVANANSSVFVGSGLLAGRQNKAEAKTLTNKNGGGFVGLKPEFFEMFHSVSLRDASA